MNGVSCGTAAGTTLVGQDYSCAVAVNTPDEHRLKIRWPRRRKGADPIRLGARLSIAPHFARQRDHYFGLLWMSKQMTPKVCNVLRAQAGGKLTRFWQLLPGLGVASQCRQR